MECNAVEGSVFNEKNYVRYQNCQQNQKQRVEKSFLEKILYEHGNNFVYAAQGSALQGDRNRTCCVRFSVWVKNPTDDMF